MQLLLIDDNQKPAAAPFRTQLLKWVGNKQRFAHEIASWFPENYGTYFEPFLGSGALLATLSPSQAVASDSFGPLMEIWRTLHCEPELLKEWYADRWTFFHGGDRIERYEQVKASYNENPNGADLLFLCRACYGGVVRFRRSDGYMSTPCGIHDPISPKSFAARVDIGHGRTLGADFREADYR